MSGPPSGPSASPSPTFPRLGAILVGVGTALETFSSIDTVLPSNVHGAIAGIGAGAVAGGLYFLGEAVTP